MQSICYEKKIYISKWQTKTILNYKYFSFLDFYLSNLLEEYF